MIRNISPYQFALFRIVLGAYLFIHFVMLLPYAAELWSNEGVLPQASLNLTYGLFPNILYCIDYPWFVVVFIGLLTLLSLMLVTGFKRNWVCLILWYGWACLFNRNNLISNPGIPFIGWLLLAMATIPAGEPWTFKSQKDTDWAFPPVLFWGAWALMAIGHTISGYDKLQSPSWANGEAMGFLLDNPLARDWFLTDWLAALPIPVLKIMTWSVLGVELFFLPLSIWSRTRPFAWLAMIGVHLGILLVVDFADLTFGMLMIHFFTFDARWLNSKKTNSIVYFDGVCGICNGAIDFLITENLQEEMKFTALQGETAKQNLGITSSADLTTIVFQQAGKTYVKSEAIIQIALATGGIWGLASVFYLIPKRFRNYLYDLLATNRYNLAEKKEACRIPSSEERKRFLP